MSFSLEQELRDAQSKYITIHQKIAQAKEQDQDKEHGAVGASEDLRMQLTEAREQFRVAYSAFTGIDAPVSLDPLMERQREATAILHQVFQSIAHLEGASSFQEEFRSLEGERYFDEDFVKCTPDKLAGMCGCHQVPLGTIRTALHSGLQHLLDDALSRTVDLNYQTGYIISYEEPVSLHTIGQAGSKEFLPIIEDAIRDPSFAKQRSGFGALYSMKDSLDPETAQGALELASRYEQEQLLFYLHNLQTEGVNCHGELSFVATLATPEAVAAIADHWDRFHEKYGAEEKKYDHVNQEFVRAFVTLIARGAPGAVDVVGKRRESLMKHFDQFLYQDEDFFNPYSKAMHMLWKSALFGQSLSDLPPRTPPEDYDPKWRRSWPFVSDYNYYLFYPDIVGCMAQRGIAGADVFYSQLVEERSRFLCREVESYLASTPHTEDYAEFRNQHFSDFLRWVETDAGPETIPALERLLHEPWRAFDRWEWWTSSPGPYTDNRARGVQDSFLPRVEASIVKLKLRHGILPLAFPHS